MTLSRLIVGDVKSIYVIGILNAFKINFPNSRTEYLNTNYNFKKINEADNGINSTTNKNWMKYIRLNGRFTWMLSIYIQLLFQRKRYFYDEVHIHFVAPFHLWMLPIYRYVGKRVVVAIWGSDLYRCKNEGQLKKILLKSDVIISCSGEMDANLKKLLPQNHLHKIQRAFFGLNVIDQIDKSKANFDKEAFKKYLGAGNRKIVVIGNNGSQEQQHLSVLSYLSSQTSSNFFFIVPVTYGGNKAYISNISKRMRDLNLEGRVLKEFMPLKEIAKIRLVTDIYIHLQTTDALSGAMREHLYAGNKVITGSWLPYGDLVESGLSLLMINHVREIGSALDNIDKLLPLSPHNLEKNACIIREISSWSSVIKTWASL